MLIVFPGTSTYLLCPPTLNPIPLGTAYSQGIEFDERLHEFHTSSTPSTNYRNSGHDEAACRVHRSSSQWRSQRRSQQEVTEKIDVMIHRYCQCPS